MAPYRLYLLRSSIICSIAMVSCTTQSNEPAEPSPSIGSPITHVQADWGLPDAISDRSGDLERYYRPDDRPAEEWPWDAPRTLYYLDRNVAVTFVKGVATDFKPVRATIRTMIQSMKARAATRPLFP